MDKTLERDYQTYKTYDKEFHMATDEEGKEEARAKVRKLYAEIQSRGTTYCDIFNLYKDAQEKGNKYIDVHDSLYDTDEKDLILGFKRYGIERFTFSSGWSRAVETAWLFIQNGCTLEGMTELHGSEKLVFGSTEKEYDTVHGYIFKVN
ncbi:MAG: hypothetical protein LUH18_09320 [Oscillospiraceae bacterium]|nr:hypothetical protein [Oscillospiraceae bacterium]